MRGVLRDAYGLTLSTDSRAAVDAYDRGVRGQLAFAADTIDHFRAAVAADPDFALGRAALASALLLDEIIPEAREQMQQAAAHPERLSPREQRHLEALRLFVSGRGPDAIPLMTEILTDTPRDIYLVQRLFFIYFWQGRSADLLALTELVRGGYGADEGFMLGLHGFALEENRHFPDARVHADRAIALDPQDAWAVHALAHVLYETGDNTGGIDLLPARIHPCSHLGYFRRHLLWHLSLLHLASGHYERVAKMFEDVYGRIPISIGSELHDSVSLAWRMDLFGHPDPARWVHLGQAVRKWLDLPLLLFHDLHVGMALASAGDWATASGHLEKMRARGQKGRNPSLPEVAVPLLDGMYAFARGDFATAVARIAPIEERIREVGGSHAQREVFHDTLLAATLRGGFADRAPDLLERRLAKRPNPGDYWVRARAPRANGAAGAGPA